MVGEKVAEESAKIRERVQKAQEIQQKRFAEEMIANNPILTNSEMGALQIKKHCQLDLAGEEMLKNAADRLHLSPRSFYRLLKLSRTIADLAGQEKISSQHLAEALQYRPKQS